MYFTRLAVNAACAPAHNQSSGGSETSQPNSSSFFKTKNKTNINELVMVKKSDDRVSTMEIFPINFASWTLSNIIQSILTSFVLVNIFL